ncbi:peptidylprolyl isomerase [Fulvivirga kasyanovii]|uniref:Peptidylprolyl isomerase n=1 Tax=Fulvivirga kasyanovii TaxID=396812 RepID=A0ABW9RQ92_9BACT|nr:peptidylprolyl isomerase [Fulvivirga kasyanovii]MTI25917.1 peptidylprolyl isomerase [Fulvivirga kasyanovii]
MKFRIWFILILIAGCKASSDVSTVKQDDSSIKSIKLFDVGGESVYTDEFAYVYKKNNVNNDSAFTHGDIKDYLDLYIKFKLKIAEAKNRGMDTTAAFIREFDTYKEQLKKPYLSENQVTEKLIAEAYQRYKEEINASHILIQVDAEAAPEDTLKAYNKILEIREQATKGTDFGKLAREYSDDPSAKMNNGNLGYFTSFQMVYPFESAAYNTEEGKVSKPVRTKFGYHLVKVLDKRASQGSVEVSHIMIRIKPNKADSLEARNKIFEIYDQAVGGVNWDDLAKQFSEDINTKNSGGRLRPFKVGQMPYTFQEAAFALSEPGDISDPVMTPYGWHIIRLEKKLPLESFKEMEPSIKSRIDRDSRAELNKKVLIERLRKENGFKETDAVQKIWDFADSTLTQGNWNYPAGNELLDDVLFSIASENYTVEDFFKYVKREQRPNSHSPEVYMRLLYNNFTDGRIITYEESHLEDKYIDYRMLVNEYREGILLFELMEQEVWNKAVEDTAGLKEYYEQHKDKYQWAQRVRATVYNSDSEEVLSEIEGLINSNDSLALSKKALEKHYNDKTALTLQVTEGVFEKGDNDVVDQIKWSPGVYKVDASGRHNLVWIEEVLEPAPKKLDEIKGLVISDYQNYLEKLWVEELREKYPVNINDSGLKYIYEKLEK